MVLRSEFMADFASPNRLLYLQDGALLTQNLNLKTLDLTGEPTLVEKPVAGNANGRAGFSVSDSGVLIYSSEGQGLANVSRYFVFEDRQG